MPKISEWFFGFPVRLLSSVLYLNKKRIKSSTLEFLFPYQILL